MKKKEIRREERRDYAMEANHASGSINCPKGEVIDKNNVIILNFDHVGLCNIS